MGIVEFLEARIAEDETIANAAAGDEGGYWLQDQDLSLTATDGPHGVAWSGLVELSRRPVVGQHMERFDPYRVLAECKAKRSVIEQHNAHEEHVRMALDLDLSPAHANERRQATHTVLRALTQVYADHPDFDPAWA